MTRTSYTMRIGASTAVPDTSPSPCAACVSPIENKAPSTKTGKYTVVPAVMWRLSMFPPFALGGIVTNIESVAGATPITPGNGRRGIVIRSVNATSVAPGAIANVLRYGSVNSSDRNPNPGKTAVHAHSPTSRWCNVTARMSPGSAPST